MPDLNAESMSKIDQSVDYLVSILKKQIISGDGFQKRGLWDRFKNFAANAWHGRYNQKNPYYFINTLGDFAGSSKKDPISSAPKVGASAPKVESFNPRTLTLQEYMEIKSLFDKLEENINSINEADGTDNLRIMRLIDDWSKTLKITLKKLFSNFSKTSASSEVESSPETDNKDGDQCRIDLENKHRDGKISHKDYFKIKSMINRGEVESACQAIEALLKSPEPEPEPEPEPKSDPVLEKKIADAYEELEEAKKKKMPDDIYEKVKKDLESYRRNPDENLWLSIKDSIHGTGPIPSRSGDDSESPEEEKFPFNLDETIPTFKKIKSALRKKEPYKKLFSKWSKIVSTLQKDKFEKLEEKLNTALVDHMEKEEFEDLLHQYKVVVSHIVNDEYISSAPTIECVSPLLPLNLEQKKNYIKIIINER